MPRPVSELMIKAKAAGLNVNCVRKRIKAGLTEEEAFFI